MKKIALYSMLAAAGLLFTACNDDYKDWNDPQSQPQPELVTIDFQAANVNAIDLRSTVADSIKIFTPTLSANKPVTATYDAVIYNDTKTDSVIVKADKDGKASTSAIQGAVMALFGADEVQREAPMSVIAYVNYEGTIMLKDATGLALTATPRYQELPDLKNDMWYMLGTDVGIGTWVNSKRVGIYTSLVAMYVNPFNYDELIYASYFSTGSEFRIHKEPGNKDIYIGGGNENGGQSFQAAKPEGSPLGNIVVGNAGYYKVILNISDPSNPIMRMEPITQTVKLYTAMAMTGLTASMEMVTTAATGENHDWLGSATVTEDGQLIGFEGSGDGFTTTWGGKAFPAGKAAAGATGIPTKAGNYNVLFNDLLGVYSFIEK